MQADDSNGLRAHRFETLDPARVDAFVSTRGGGRSAAPYASLNLGLRVGDDPAAVLANRRLLFDAYGVSLETSVWCKQVHRDDVVVIDEAAMAPGADGRRDRGALDEETIVNEADALVTDLVGVPLCVTLADCVPVVLYDPEHHALGLAHAGWGGTVARISSRTLAVMGERYGTDPRHVIAAIGPSISAEHYEVGQEVVDAAAAGYGEDSGVIRVDGAGRTMFDLWGANRFDLEAAGVPAAQIEVAGMCTADALDEFYSHRVEGLTGRFIAMARLEALVGL